MFEDDETRVLGACGAKQNVSQPSKMSDNYLPLSHPAMLVLIFCIEVPPFSSRLQSSVLDNP